MESTRKIVKDSFFFFFGQRRWSTPAVNGLTWHGRVGDAWDAWDAWGAWECGARERVGAWHAKRLRARESAWGRVGTRGARGGALPDLWRRVAARGRVSKEPETSGGAWGRVRGQIRPILVSMDRS